MSKNYVAIMAGGIGSRFWPSSRAHRPKQFLDILGVGKSLIQLTYERFAKVVPEEHIFIVTNEQYKQLVKQHLPKVTDNQILCEPSRNNTAPCVAYTAFKLRSLDPDANFVVAPSDALILKEDVFVEALQKALDFTQTHGAIVTLGITPSRPDTGYGYINFDAAEEEAAPATEGVGPVHRVVEFKEKPDETTAQQYLDSGRYLWNAGIFVSKAATMLVAFETHAREIYQILKAGDAQYNTSEEQSFINKAYPTTPAISVDYAIMEKADNVFTIPVEFGWSDLGTWGSLHQEKSKDADRNTGTAVKVLTLNTTNTLVHAPQEKLVIIKGLDDYIVVDEEDVLMIFPKSEEQEIKALTKRIEELEGKRYL